MILEKKLLSKLKTAFRDEGKVHIQTLENKISIFSPKILVTLDFFKYGRNYLTEQLGFDEDIHIHLMDIHLENVDKMLLGDYRVENVKGEEEISKKDRVGKMLILIDDIGRESMVTNFSTEGFEMLVKSIRKIENDSLFAPELRENHVTIDDADKKFHDLVKYFSTNAIKNSSGSYFIREDFTVCEGETDSWLIFKIVKKTQKTKI